MGNMSEVQHWFEVSIERASNNMHRLYALGRIADIHSRIGTGESCLPYYQQLVAIDPNDPWAWHNMSLVYDNLYDYKNAFICNRKALDVGQFGAAAYILDNLVRDYNGRVLDDPLLEIPRYPMSEEAREAFFKAQRKSHSSFFGRMFGN